MYDDRYLKGIQHFNAREFYDAHEVWESLWHEEHGEANEFIQGLIQFATALHHFESQNLKGAKLLYEGGVELLSPYKPMYWDLPVDKLLGNMERCMEGLLTYKQSELPGRYHPDKDQFPVRVNPELIPKIELAASPKQDR